MGAAALRDVRAPTPLSQGLIDDAISDLDGDLRELRFLCTAALARLAGLDAELAAACPHHGTREVLARGAASATRRQRSIAAQLRALRAEGQLAYRTESLVARLSAGRSALADRLRVEQALVAALLAAPDWQSPSILHSRSSAAGRQTGQIRAHENDYKRDRHVDAEVYERRYVESMIDEPGDARALLTGCGMSAFTTILWWLLGEGKLARPVIAGQGLYHESRLLLERMLPGRVHFVDEADADALLWTIDALRPGVVFLDSLSNTARMPMPDLGRVIEQLRGSDTYLIVDNTCLSVGCQPIALAGDRVHLVVFESLLKYAQLGLDRINAGVIVARAADAEALDRCREHTGANIPDIAVHALPPPDRRTLERRLRRLERNARYLAARLAECAPPGVIVVHPGLPDHPAAGVAARLQNGASSAGPSGFSGGCLSVILPDSDQCLDRQRRLVEAAVTEAVRREISLAVGSSFGFDTARIYLTAAHAERGTPFVRIAAGTEHRLELEPLADALVAALAATVERVT